MRKGNSVIIVLVFVLVAIVVGLMIYKNTNTSSTLLTKNEYKPGGNCKVYGWNKSGDYLPKYIVQAGDSLLTISERELGDNSRVDELITLNLDKYPSFSSDKSFIEVGWILLLPPKGVSTSSGFIKQMSGELMAVEGEGAWMIYSDSTGGTGPWLPEKDLKKRQVEKFQPGDCVRMIYDAQNGTIFAFERQ